MFYFVLLTVNTIKLSKPEKGAMVENMICRMAQMGQLNTRISEKELIQLLESVNQQMPKSTSTVKFDRRRAALDSDDDDLQYSNNYFPIFLIEMSEIDLLYLN